MKKLRFEFRADSTAQRAFNAGTAAPPAADGTLPPASATPSVAYKRDPLWTWVEDSRRRSRRQAPRDARVRIALTKIHRVPGARAASSRSGRLVKAIETVLADPLAARTVRAASSASSRTCRPRSCAKLYKTVITIDRSSFRLRLFKKFRVIKRYGVAVGHARLPDADRPLRASRASRSTRPGPRRTRPGRGRWPASRSPAARANNPLRARWMGVSGAVGIHGTGQPWSIGTRASHGCIRMTVADVIDLFERVELGTPVLIR